MTRTEPAPGSKPSASSRPAGRPLPPCLANPQLWDSSDNTDAIEACRHQCPRRIQCAQEALTDLEGVDGVVAGVALPPQNEHGTSKRRRAAVKHLQTIADQEPQRRASRPAPPAKPASSSTYHPHLGTAQQPDTPGGGHHTACRTAEAGQPDKPRHPDHVTTAGAAELTGLSVGYLKQLRRQRKGPKWWRTSDGVVHYWVADVEKWKDRWQRRHTVISRNQQRRGVTVGPAAPALGSRASSDNAAAPGVAADHTEVHHEGEHPTVVTGPTPFTSTGIGSVRTPSAQRDISGESDMTGNPVGTVRRLRGTGHGTDVQDWMPRTGRGKRDPVDNPTPAAPIARAS